MNKIIHTQSTHITDAMIKGLALLFCSDLSEIRLERDEGEGDIQGGRKGTDRGGCTIRNGVKWCEEKR